MLLAVDIGNTNVVLGLYEGPRLEHTLRIATVRTRTADEHSVLLKQLLDLRGLSPATIDAAIVASVVPPLTEVVARAIRQACGHEPLVVGGPGLKTGIRIRYDNPREVGADRIVNAVAAHERGQGSAIVVDFGTATTFDCVSADGEYLGGVIVPGVQVSLDGLLGRAAKLTRIELAEPPQVIGRNTPNAMQSGIVYGYASLIDGLVDKIVAELGFPCRVIATGGLASLIAPHARRVDEICPDLTLDGLRLIYEKNSHSTRGRLTAQ
jgi:type III pantothenate kinase